MNVVLSDLQPLPLFARTALTQPSHIFSVPLSLLMKIVITFMHA